MDMEIEKQSEELTKLLKGLRVIAAVVQKENMVMIQFENQTRLFIDSKAALELSVT